MHCSLVGFSLALQGMACSIRGMFCSDCRVLTRQLSWNRYTSMITGFIVLGVQNLQHLDGGPLQDHHARRDGEGHSQAEPSRQCQAGW